MNLDLKYRPTTFQEMVGNKTTVDLLISTFSQKNMPKFMIFTGQPGTGKTTAAYIVAKEIALKEVDDIQKIDGMKKSIEANLYEKGTSDPNSKITIYDIGEQSDLEYIQGIATNIKNGAVTGKKILIIDELQMVKTSLQDPLLKATEFMPPNVHVIITTSNRRKIAKALWDRADLKLMFQHPEFNESYEYLRSIVKAENIKIDAYNLKELITLNKNNLRLCLKNLTLIKDNTQEGIKKLITERENKSKIYLEYFRALRTNALEFHLFVELIEDTVEYVHGLPLFLKEYLKTTYTTLGSTKAYREELHEVMSQFREKDLIDLLIELSKIPYMTQDQAEAYLIGVAYQLNNVIEAQSDEADKLILQHKINNKQEYDQVVQLNRVTQDSVADTTGMDLNAILSPTSTSPNSSNQFIYKEDIELSEIYTNEVPKLKTLEERIKEEEDKRLAKQSVQVPVMPDMQYTQHISTSTDIPQIPVANWSNKQTTEPNQLAQHNPFDTSTPNNLNNTNTEDLIKYLESDDKSGFIDFNKVRKLYGEK